MKLIRFIFPFLFIRNWYDGAWELSRARLIFFCVLLGFLIVGLGLVAVLQAPVEYSVVYEST